MPPQHSDKTNDCISIICGCCHFRPAGTDAQRLLVATIRKCAGDSDHLMVTDHKGRIIYVTSKLAELLGSTPKALLRTDFARLMAQPFMQLHSKWMKVWVWWWGC
jgi:hypothetical protein